MKITRYKCYVNYNNSFVTKHQYHSYSDAHKEFAIKITKTQNDFSFYRYRIE